MRLLTVCCALLAACAAGSPAHAASTSAQTPQQMLADAMLTISERSYDNPETLPAWQMVARATADFLDANPSLWEADDLEFTSALGRFSAEASALNGEPLDEASPPPASTEWERVRRDGDFRTMGLSRWVIDRDRRGSGCGAWSLLIGRTEGRSVSGAWWRWPGGSVDAPDLYGGWAGEWAIWQHGDGLRAVFAGGWGTGGTGDPLFGSGGLLESAGDGWRTLDLCGTGDPAQTYRDYHADAVPWRFLKAYLRLQDLNGDGVPEIVGAHEYGKQRAGPHTGEWTQRDYYVYKVIGSQLRQVWYAKVESPRGIVLRFLEGLDYGSEPMVRNASASAEIVTRARALGFFEQDVDSGDWWLLRDPAIGEDSGSMLVFMTDALWRFQVRRVAGQRWRVSGFEKEPGGYEAYYRNR